MYRAVLLFAFFVSAGAYAQHSRGGKVAPGVSAFEPDLSLLEDWTEKAQLSEPCRTPFVATYTGASKSLRFIAAEHNQGPDTATVKLFKKSMVAAKPDLLILEGFPSEFGISPEGLKR